MSMKILHFNSFLKAYSPSNIFNRLYYGNKHNKKFLYKDGKLISGTINYYPRKENEIEPEVTPSKLLRVQRIKKVSGNPYWERRLLREFGLMESPNIAVVKNIPENNARLWKIKHLIKVTPINFVNGEPTAEDVNHTYLKENGDCVVIKSIDGLNERIEASERFEKDNSRLNNENMRKDSRQKWLTGWE